MRTKTAHTPTTTTERKRAMTKRLPPDPENQNDERAEWAASALRDFQRNTRTDDEDALSDLLCDLMHWSDRNNCDFGAELSRARLHYEAETAAPVENDFDMLCPRCGASDQIDVAATVFVRLCRDGTDDTQAHSGDHTWDDNSPALCCACDYAGTVRAFCRTESSDEKPVLLAAAELVIERWSNGDLADAVRQLDAAIAEAKGGAK